jgi:hypothetical protein
VGHRYLPNMWGKKNEVRHFGKWKSPNTLEKLLEVFYAIWKIYVVFSFII